MKSRVENFIFLFFLFVASQALATDDLKSDIKNSATEVGHAFRDGGKAVGQAAKKGAQSVGSAAKNVGHSVAHSTDKTTKPQKASSTKSSD